MAVDAAQSPVSSSSTLWAQASKEWVIPAKPKPGRKPNKDSASPKVCQEVDSKGRRVQNRAAQRAFRERKQSQLADLQARVQSYEQGEIERSVALQQISKRLKEENEQLKSENAALKDEVVRLKERVDAVNVVTAAAAAATAPANARREKRDDTNNLKRWRDGSAGSVGSVRSADGDVLLESMTRKRFRVDTESPGHSTTPIPQLSHGVSYMPSPPSVASSPDSNDISGGPFSPLPFAPPSSGSARASSMYSTSALYSLPMRDANKSFDSFGSIPPFDNFDCGLCTENSPCVCREMVMQQANVVSGIGGPIQDYIHDYSMSQDQGPTTLKTEDAETSDVRPTLNIIEIPPATEDTQPVDAPAHTSASMSPKSPVLENFPVYQPAVPLRRNSTLTQQPNHDVPFQIRLPSPEPTPASSSSSSSRSVPLPLKGTRGSASGTVWHLTPAAAPMCSGDPSNCPACKDDDFGKAFCRALGNSAGSTSKPCASCPNPEACGKAPLEACSSGSSSASSSSFTQGSLRVIELMPAKPEHQLASLSTNSSRLSVNLRSASTAIASASLRSIAEEVEGSSTNDSTNPVEKIPVNEAWARLKSHPNIAFADLSMLADVVARRTKCSGPVAVIHPAPGSITPERDAARSPAVPEPEIAVKTAHENARPQRKDGAPVLLTDPHAHFKAQEQQRAHYSSPPATAPASVSAFIPVSASKLPSALSAPRGTTSSASGLGPNAVGRPALVPQEELRECGRRRIREVDAAGVREALRILDAQFGKHR